MVSTGSQVVPSGHNSTASAPSPLDALGVAERLLAGAAVASATIYVLINALYLEFYDDFGVRPEDVGLDRLAVLARSAWVAIVLIAIAAGLVAIYALLEFLPGSSALRSKRKLALGVVAILSAIAIVGGFFIAKEAVETRADDLRNGENVDGVGFKIPFVDLQSNRATLAWLGEPPEPAVVAKPFLTYLGGNDDAAVFVECGKTTHIVPSGDLVITIVSTAAGSNDSQQQDDFAEFCANE